MEKDGERTTCEEKTSVIPVVCAEPRWRRIDVWRSHERDERQEDVQRHNTRKTRVKSRADRRLGLICGRLSSKTWPAQNTVRYEQPATMSITVPTPETGILPA